MRIDNLIPQKKLEANNPALPSSSSTDIKVVHEVHILDRSGSMAGNKYRNATHGIEEDIKQARSNASLYPNINTTMSVIEFDDSTVIHYYAVPIDKCLIPRWGGVRSTTALYSTLGKTIEYFLKLKKKEDKVLMKIFTDGGENASLGKYQADQSGGCPILRDLIVKVQKEDNFIITFVGTKLDTDNIVRKLGIEESNTLVHENTGESVEKSYIRGVEARVDFMANVSAGKDVSRGYYSKEL